MPRDGAGDRGRAVHPQGIDDTAYRDVAGELGCLHRDPWPPVQRPGPSGEPDGLDPADARGRVSRLRRGAVGGKPSGSLRSAGWVTVPAHHATVWAQTLAVE